MLRNKVICESLYPFPIFSEQVREIMCLMRDGNESIVIFL